MDLKQTRKAIQKEAEEYTGEAFNTNDEERRQMEHEAFVAGAEHVLHELKEAYAQLEHEKRKLGETYYAIDIFAERAPRSDETHQEHYHRLAALFERETGRRAPKPDEKITSNGMFNSDDGRAWIEFCHEPTTALKTIANRNK